MDNQNIAKSEAQISSMEASTSSFLSNNSHNVNFHFKTQKETNQKTIQCLKLNPLNPYKFYNVNTLISSIKSVVPFRQPKLKSVYKSSEVVVQSISSSSKETYLHVLSSQDMKRYRIEGYKELHLGAIKLGIQPLFLAGKSVTYFLAILDTRWQTFEKALISAIEVRLNQGNVVVQMEPNFTIDLHKPTLPETIKVVIQINGLAIKRDESAHPVHHTMNYKVQTHMFSMSHNNLSITRFTIGERRIIQPKTFKQNQLSFLP